MVVCKFCGKEPCLSPNRDTGTFRVKCRCGARSQPGDTQDQAIDNWEAQMDAPIVFRAPGV